MFAATVVSELVILILYFKTRSGTLELGYLWFNPIGALLVVLLAVLIQIFLGKGEEKDA